MPKSLLCFTTALLIACASPLALSQVYSWVDENGKKHFGDRIPPQYQDQASEYKIAEPNSAEAVEPTTRRPVQTSPYSTRSSSDSAGSRTRYENHGTVASDGSCQARKAAYERAQECWGQCRQYNAYSGTSKINAASQRCSRCPNLEKPRC